MATRKDTVEDVVRALPCALKAHYPLSISRVESDGGVAIYGSVRTTSDHWDGCGGRTDLHEVLAALWAAILRTNGVASSRLIDMEGMCGSPEVYQRWLVFDQPFGGVFQRRVHERHWKQLLAHTAWAYHAIADAIGMKPPSVRQPSWHEDAEPSWLGALRALVEVKGEELWVSRENPDWQYYTAGENAVSVVELRPGAALRLRASVGQYNPTVVRIGENEVLRAGDMVNAVSTRLLRLGSRLVQCVEGSESVPWKGLGSAPGDRATIAIPLESHCVFLGSRAIIVLKQDCSYRRYLRIRGDWGTQKHTGIGILQSRRKLCMVGEGRSVEA